jgi:hypothetical protein
MARRTLMSSKGLRLTFMRMTPVCAVSAFEISIPGIAFAASSVARLKA